MFNCTYFHKLFENEVHAFMKKYDGGQVNECTLKI